MQRFELALRQRIHRKRLCILVIDGQPLSRKMAVEILSAECDVITASTARDALENYLQYAPDIVFMDIDTPAMNGLDIADRIALLDHEAYIILLSEDHMLQTTPFSGEQCVYGHVIKPVTRQKIGVHLLQFKTMYPNRGAKRA